MSESDRALEIVQLAVQALSERGAKARASVTALAQLAHTVGNPVGRIVMPSAAPATSEPADPRRAAVPVIRPESTQAAPARPDLAPTTSALPPTPKVPEISVQRMADCSAVGPIAPAAGSKAERLAAMRQVVLPCTRCPNLVRSRTQVVFGVGNPEAELMFVGEAPGADEDAAGEPFVGKAGQLLTKIIETMGYARNDVYIANVLKCRPDMPAGESGNRKPTLAEMNTCKPYLLEQISIIRPRVLVGLGATAMEGLLGGDKFPITKKRGEWHEFAGTPLMPTFHPAYLLRNQALSEKRRVWEDMLAVLEKLERPISEKQRAYFLSR
jgi:uracil-DNA glycosylase